MLERTPDSRIDILIHHSSCRRSLVKTSQAELVQLNDLCVDTDGVACRVGWCCERAGCLGKSSDRCRVAVGDRSLEPFSLLTSMSLNDGVTLSSVPTKPSSIRLPESDSIG